MIFPNKSYSGVIHESMQSAKSLEGHPNERLDLPILREVGHAHQGTISRHFRRDPAKLAVPPIAPPPP
jgi:hypothetical protein